MPLRINEEFPHGHGDSFRKLHKKMSRNGHYQKVRRPTGLEVYNDASRILEELLEARIDESLRGHNRPRRNKTDPTVERVSMDTGEKPIVTRSKTMPSKYRESKDGGVNGSDKLKMRNGDHDNGSMSSMDTEDEDSQTTGKRRKKSLFKRTTERLMQTFQRDKKSKKFHEDKEEGGSPKSPTKKRKLKPKKKSKSGVVSESSRHISAHVNEDKSVDYGEMLNIKDKDGTVHSEVHSHKDRIGSFSSLLRPFRKNRKAGGIPSTTGDNSSKTLECECTIEDIRDYDPKKDQQRVNRERPNILPDRARPHAPLDPSPPPSRDGSTVGSTDNSSKLPPPPPSGNSSRLPPPPPPRADSTAGSTDKSSKFIPPPPRPVPVKHEGSPSPQRSFKSSSPSPSDSARYSPYRQMGGGSSSTGFPVSDYSLGSRSDAPQGILSSVLDIPGDDIEFMDTDNNKPPRVPESSISIEGIVDHSGGQKFHDSLGLMNFKWLQDADQANRVDMEIDERTVSTQREDGAIEMTTTVTAVRTVVMPELAEEDEYDYADGATGEEPEGMEEDGERNKDEIYGKIAQKLIEMADSYSASVSDHESQGAVAAEPSQLSELEKKIIACLRSGGDKNTKKLEDKMDEIKNNAKQDAYDRFKSTVQHSMGNDTSWDLLAFLFYTTKGVVSAVGKGTKTANQAKEFTLQYISDTYASWIVEQGGFDSMLSSGESDYDVD